MNAILKIAITQIKVQLRERGSVITLFVVPVIMVLFIGKFAVGGGSTMSVLDVVRSAEAKTTSIKPFSDEFVALLRQDVANQFYVCDLSDPGNQVAECKLKAASDTDPAALAKQRLEDGISEGTITLASSFTADLLAGKQANIQISVKNNPQVSQVISQDVQAVNARLGGAIVAARQVAAQMVADPKAFENAYTLTIAAWEQNPVSVQETSSTVTGQAAGTGFGQSAPGIGAQFVLMTALTLAQLFITGRQNWTTQRLLMMPITKGQILSGRLLGQFLLCLMSFTVMLVCGTLFGSVKWGDPLGVAAVVLAYTAAVTAMGLAVSTIAKTVGQASAFPLLLSLTLAPLGGAWWPIDLTPQAMQIVGKIISPIAWSQSAFSQLVYYGASLVDVLPQIGVLLIFAVVFFTFGLLRFRHDE